jgi:hypothetical protein
VSERASERARKRETETREGGRESERAKASERERESQSETKKISILRRDTYNKKRRLKKIRARGEKRRKGTESGVSMRKIALEKRGVFAAKREKGPSLEKRKKRKETESGV